MQLNTIIMKYIIHILTIFLSIAGNAQIIVTMTDYNGNDLTNGNYIKDTQGYLNKFTGTWKYTSGNEEFIIKIIKAEHINYNYFFSDDLFGGYKYIKDGIVKFDNLNFQYIDHTNTNSQHFADFLGSGLYNNYNSVAMNGFDAVGSRRIYIDLEVIPNTNPVQMKWKMENRENWVINNQGFRQGTGPGLPNNIILVKQ